MLFFLAFCSSKNLEKVSIIFFEQHNCFNNNNKNVTWAANQYIGMISEGSCDTKDWSNDAENSDLPSPE